MRFFKGGKLDDLFKQIWSLEQEFQQSPSKELAAQLVICLQKVAHMGYYNPVLGISWTPMEMKNKLSRYSGYEASGLADFAEGLIGPKNN